jgi:hypothetical protein
MDIPGMLMNFNNLSMQDTLVQSQPAINQHNKEYNYMDDELTSALFQDNLDIYEGDNHMLELGVPNVRCSKYYDDEDFIYARMKFSEDLKIDIDFNVINYLTQNNIMLDFSEQTLDNQKIYAKILYVYQFVSTYYSSLSHLQPLDRIKHMPRDLLVWVDNLVITLRYILDKDLFNYNIANTDVEEEYYNELVYGLNLTICHLKMLLNHYRVLNIPIYNMEEKHIKKLFKVLNNMCVIMIFFRNML